jgi:DNA-binding transcriptional LysR family regulator
MLHSFSQHPSDHIIKKDLPTYAFHKYNFGMRDLKLDQLQTFVDVVELGTFTAAAERLGISQPAVSLQIRQLEKKIGVRLIERVGKRATPTQAGAELIEHARRIKNAVSEAISDMDAYSNDTLGRVRIGIGATACIYLLPPILRDMRSKFPTLDITVRTGNTADILKDIEENMLDLGLVTLPAQGRMFDVTPILEDEFVVIGSKEIYELPEIATPAELARLPLILYEAGGNTRRIVNEWFSRASVPLKPIMDLGNVEAIKELVGAGLGCAILPRTAIRKNNERVPLAVRSLSPCLYRELALVMRHDKPRHKGLREMVKAIDVLKE